MVKKKTETNRLIDWIVLLLVFTSLVLVILHIGKGLSKYNLEHGKTKSSVILETNPHREVR